MALLWFLGVYLVVLAFVPALTRLRTWRGRSRSWSRRCSSPPRPSTGFGSPSARRSRASLNFVIVWLIPVAIGVAYARRLISPRAALAVAAGALAAQVVLAVAGPYEVSLVVTGAERMSNVSPPTLLLALHCTWMSCLFVAAAGRHPAVGRAAAGLARRRRWATGER